MRGGAVSGGTGGSDDSQLLAAIGAGLGPEMLERALTHRSYAYENGGLPTNERLEFLGDAVLGLIVTDTLFREYPDLPEGQLAKLRAAVVNMRALAGVARGLRLGRYVRLGRGEEGTGGRDKSSILADTLEARDRRGLHRARPGRGVRARAPAVRPGHRRSAAARRRARLEDLPAGAHRVRGARRARVPRRGERSRPPEVLPGHRSGSAADAYGSGSGRSKKEAEQQAAEAAWNRSARPRAGLPATRAGPPAACPGGCRRGPARGRAGGRAAGAVAGPAAGLACPSFPRSRSSAAAWSGMWSAAPSSSVEVLHPRAIRRHLAGPDDFAAALAGGDHRRAQRAASTSGCRLGRRPARCSRTSG